MSTESTPKKKTPWQFQPLPPDHLHPLTHLYQARTQYRLVCEQPNKGDKAIERETIASFQVAESLGFMGDFRQWEHLLRIHE